MVNIYTVHETVTVATFPAIVTVSVIPPGGGGAEQQLKERTQ